MNNSPTFWIDGTTTATDNKSNNKLNNKLNNKSNNQSNNQSNNKSNNKSNNISKNINRNKKNNVNRRKIIQEEQRILNQEENIFEKIKKIQSQESTKNRNRSQNRYPNYRQPFKQRKDKFKKKKGYRQQIPINASNIGLDNNRGSHHTDEITVKDITDQYTQLLDNLKTLNSTTADDENLQMMKNLVVKLYRYIKDVNETFKESPQERTRRINQLVHKLKSNKEFNQKLMVVVALNKKNRLNKKNYQNTLQNLGNNTNNKSNKNNLQKYVNFLKNDESDIDTLLSNLDQQPKSNSNNKPSNGNSSNGNKNNSNSSNDNKNNGNSSNDNKNNGNNKKTNKTNDNSWFF